MVAGFASLEHRTASIDGELPVIRTTQTRGVPWSSSRWRHVPSIVPRASQPSGDLGLCTAKDRDRAEPNDSSIGLNQACVREHTNAVRAGGHAIPTCLKASPRGTKRPETLPLRATFRRAFAQPANGTFRFHVPRIGDPFYISLAKSRGGRIESRPRLSCWGGFAITRGIHENQPNEPNCQIGSVRMIEDSLSLPPPERSESDARVVTFLV